MLTISSIRVSIGTVTFVEENKFIKLSVSVSKRVFWQSEKIQIVYLSSFFRVFNLYYFVIAGLLSFFKV